MSEKEIKIDIDENNDDEMVEENIENNEENKKEKSHKEEDKILKELNKLSKDELIKKYINLSDETKKIILQNEENEKNGNEYLDRYKRTLAEMENLRKRTTQEKQDSLKYANFNIISDLLIVLDDFERAIESAKNEDKMDLLHFVEGVEMIEKQFADLLFKKYGTAKYCDEGDVFDPQLHQAMMLEEGDYEDETVLEVFRKGYMLHDRVVRHAQVKVGKPKDK